MKFNALCQFPADDALLRMTDNQKKTENLSASAVVASSLRQQQTVRSCLTKTLLVMKLTFILLTAVALQGYSKGLSQTVTFSGKDVPLDQIFSTIKQQTGYVVLYDYIILNGSKPVSVSVKDVALSDFLNQVLHEQALDYIIKKKAIFIRKLATAASKSNTTAVIVSSQLLPPPIDISGRITDKDGKALEGANVMVKGKKMGTVTDANGVFTLKGLSADDIIIISFTGYKDQTFKVGTRTSFVLSLEHNDSPLDEIVIKAYNTTTTRTDVGNITKVKGEDIRKQPVGNPLLALQGQPGVFITQNSGIAGGGVTVRVGTLQNSINNGNDPLIVVDGMPISSQSPVPFSGPLGNSGNKTNGGQNGAGSALSYINPSDIESIEILKDASATAIYGSRAANGAILITTKKGKIGQTKVDINLQQGWGKVTCKLDMLNATQYLEMRHEAKANDNAAILSTDFDLNGVWDTTNHTNWQKTLIGGTSKYTNISAGISGGNNLIQYLVSGTYHRETTVFPGDFSDKKGSLHFNINSNTANQKFKFQLTGSYLADNNSLPAIDLTGAALTTEPVAPKLYNADGSLNWAINPATGNSTWINPLANTLLPFQNRTTNLIATSQVSYRILPGLELKSSFNHNAVLTNAFQAYVVQAAIKPETRNGSNPSSVSYFDFNSRSISIEPQLIYKRKIGKGNLDAVLGSTILQNKSNAYYFGGTGFLSDALIENPTSASSIATFGTVATNQYKYNAVFGLLNYNWNGKYIIDLSMRRDGTSRFGTENQFHTFGSIGGAWIFSEEKAIKGVFKFLSFGKFRGSYGRTGSDQIANYQYQNLYNPIAGVTVAYQGIPTIASAGINNPLLAWEETNKLQLGFNLGFLSDRILLAGTYTRNRSSNQLLTTPLPMTTGFGNYFTNLPATVQNTILEGELNTVNIKTKNIQWNTSFNLTIPRNKLISFTDISKSPYNSIYIIGQPVSLTRLFYSLGVDPLTGIYMFADSRGNPVISPNATTDRFVTTTYPKYAGGFKNVLTYKGLQLDIFFQFANQIGSNLIYFAGGAAPGIFTVGSSNQPVTVLNRWRKPGDITYIKRFSTTLSNGVINTSDANVIDASYLRLKNLSLSYELPISWKQKVHLQNCRVYTSGQNLLTITKYKGLDPESQGTGNLPPLRVITVGIQAAL